MTTILKCTQSFRALHTDGLEEEDIRQQEYLHQLRTSTGMEVSYPKKPFTRWSDGAQGFLSVQ
jgi:hypothetical protein